MKIQTEVKFLRRKHVEGIKKDSGEPYAFDNYFFLDNENIEIQLGTGFGDDNKALKEKLATLVAFKDYVVDINLENINGYNRLTLVNLKAK